MSLSPAEKDALFLQLLNATDAFAVENVRSGRGGPFGASIHVYDPQRGQATLIGGLAANAVLATGMGSAHAEDQAMNPVAVAALKDYLKTHNADKRLEVVMSSSGESCPACHAKQEILARALIAEQLLAPKKFFVNYGASYQQTADIAGFNDAIYFQDMQKPEAERMIQSAQASVAKIPKDIARIFESKSKACAVIVLPNGVLITGTEDQKSDLIATAEVSAIRAASHYQKNGGSDKPWDLQRATLYTSGLDRGPLEYAECQWANVGMRIGVRHRNSGLWATREAPGISNTALFKIIASEDYTNPQSELCVRQLTPFANLAQHAWKEKLESEADPSKLLYNGASLQS